MPAQHAPVENATALAPAPFPRILCAVDGSRYADEAVGQAIELAGAGGAVTFLAVSARGAAGAMSPLSTGAAEDALKRAQSAAGAARVRGATVLRHDDDPRRVILDAARGFDLLVLGAHGHRRAAGLMLGNTPIAALHGSPVPVLVARPARTPFPAEILLATDGSPAMAPTVAVTAALARRHAAHVTLLHVDHGDHVNRRALAEESAALSAAIGREPVLLELEGHAPSRIAEVAYDLPASLVITGSRLLSGIRALGSVSERTGVVAPCSVLVMRGEAAAAARP